MAQFLHVANGTSTTGTIQQSGLPGRVSIWADVLYDGPVPGDLNDAQLLELRARHLASDDSTVPEVVADLEGWRSAIADPSYDELVLWYEHDLFDQLNLIQLLNWIDGSDSRGRTISLICIGSFPGRPHFKGLGELPAPELASLFETRRPLIDPQYELATRAWSAFRSPNPRSIETLLETDTSALPFLARALRRYLQEFPWIDDGLSRSERRLLQLASSGPLDIWSAFPLMHGGESAYYITDASLRQLIEDLASEPSPLIGVDADFSSEALPDGTVTITDVGHAVLSGQTDRIQLRGIDRWFGGVHMHGSGPVWRWNDLHQSIGLH
jgi:hypothetical protein